MGAKYLFTIFVLPFAYQFSTLWGGEGGCMCHSTGYSFHLFDSGKGCENPRGAGYSHTLPIRVCAAQRGRDFEAPDLERGIKNCGSRLYLLLKIVADCEEAFI